MACTVNLIREIFTGRRDFLEHQQNIIVILQPSFPIWAQFHQHIYIQLLRHVAPISVRIQSSCQCLFTLLGSTGTKAARRTLMKLTPGLRLRFPHFEFGKTLNGLHRHI